MGAEGQHVEDRGMSILLRYQGPSVDDGTMNVYDVAKNMVAFSDYVVEATHKVYGKDVQVTAEVNAFQRGSFVTDLVFNVAGVGATMLTIAPDIGGVVTAVKESLELFVFLKGEKPTKIEHRDDRSVNVTNNNGQVTQVNIESLHLTMDEKAGKSAAVFVAEALLKSGVNNVQITSDGEQVAKITGNEAGFFKPISDEEAVAEQVLSMGLTILEPSFKDGTSNKWTMYDGEASLQFAMEDLDFIARVDSGEPFRKGDVLLCDVRFTQTRSGQKLKIQRAIVKVHDHKIGVEQTEFDLGPADD